MTSTSSLHSNRRPTLQRWLGFILLGIFLLLITGCQAGNMDSQPYYRPLSASDFFADGRSARAIVSGTVPQTDLPVDDPSITGKNADGTYITNFPVPVTTDLVKRGQERFGIYCVVCHGPDGHGNGKVIPYGMPKPPDLLGSDVKAFDNGRIFDIITTGQGNMFSYAYRVKPPDRWAVIAYLRAMQLKNGHLTQDLTPEELQQLGK